MPHTNLTSLFTDIADAIRAKTGDSTTIKADDFPTAIAEIPTGGGDIPILHGRKLVAGTVAPAVATNQLKISLDSSLGMPTGCIYWTDDDYFADTTKEWAIGGFCVFTDIDAPTGLSGNLYKYSATSTTVRTNFTSATTTAGSIGKPTTMSQQGHTVLWGYNSSSSYVYLCTPYGFRVGAEYKYILFF